MAFKPRLTFAQIISMNVGFFGIQYSFGLQQSAVNPIYDFLGATPDQLPLLNLAGPVTGLRGPHRGGHHAHQDPGPGAVLVEAGGVDQRP